MFAELILWKVERLLMTMSTKTGSLPYDSSKTMQFALLCFLSCELHHRIQLSIVRCPLWAWSSEVERLSLECMYALNISSNLLVLICTELCNKCELGFLFVGCILAECC